MKLQSVIDRCISNGAKRISLSPNQYRTLFRGIRDNKAKYWRLYRRVLILHWPQTKAPVPSDWGTRRMK